MTTGTPPEPPAGALRRWAAERLELPADVPSKEARAAFMQRLRDEDFMPPASWQQASGALLLNRASESLRADVFTAEEARLRGEVESFAVGFFSLEVGGREKRWRELWQQCGVSPKLTARLRALEPGLHVPSESDLGNPTESEVADILRELFLLRPQAKAIRRQQIFAQLGPQSRPRLACAAESLVNRNPELARLEPVFIQQLTTWERRAVKRGENRERRRNAPAPAPGPTVTVPERPQTNSWGLLGVLVIVLSAVGRILTSGSGTSTSPPPYKFTPPPTFPAFNPDVWRQELERNDFRPPVRSEWPPAATTRPQLGDEIKDTDTRKKYQDILKRIQERESKTPVPSTRP